MIHSKLTLTKLSKLGEISLCGSRDYKINNVLVNNKPNSGMLLLTFRPYDNSLTTLSKGLFEKKSKFNSHNWSTNMTWAS